MGEFVDQMAKIWSEPSPSSMPAEPAIRRTWEWLSAKHLEAHRANDPARRQVFWEAMVALDHAAMMVRINLEPADAIMPRPKAGT